VTPRCRLPARASSRGADSQPTHPPCGVGILPAHLPRGVGILPAHLPRGVGFQPAHPYRPPSREQPRLPGISRPSLSRYPYKLTEHVTRSVELSAPTLILYLIRPAVECGELILRFGYGERCRCKIEGSMTSYGVSKAVNQFPALQQNKRQVKEEPLKLHGSERTRDIHALHAYC